MSQDNNDENDDSTNVTDDGNVNDQDNNSGGAGADAGANNQALENFDDADIDAIDDIDELREKLKGNNKQNKKLFERTMKAEGKVKDPKTGKWVKKQAAPAAAAPAAAAAEPKGDSLSSMDTIALINAKVATDDIPEVVDYAKLKGISIAEALETPIVKTLLKESNEERATANATNTGPTRRGSQKPTAGNMLDKASKTGELPESDEDMAALADAFIEKKASENRTK